MQVFGDSGAPFATVGAPMGAASIRCALVVHLDGDLPPFGHDDVVPIAGPATQSTCDLDAVSACANVATGFRPISAVASVRLVDEDTGQRIGFRTPALDGRAAFDAQPTRRCRRGMRAPDREPGDRGGRREAYHAATLTRFPTASAGTNDQGRIRHPLRQPGTTSNTEERHG